MSRAPAEQLQRGFVRSSPPPSPLCQVSRKSPVCLSPPVVNAHHFSLHAEEVRVKRHRQAEEEEEALQTKDVVVVEARPPGSTGQLT